MVEVVSDAVDPAAPTDDEVSGRAATKSVWVATAVTSLATLFVGLRNIGRSFNYDEGVTYATFINGGSPWRALTTQLVFNNHQMFSVTQAIAWRLGFVGETAQRLLPVACGVATVGLLTWWVGRRTDALAGAFAGAILLLHPIYVAEFRTLRGYALATLAVLVAAIATERSWRDERRRWLWIGAVAMVVAVTTHAYGVLPIVLVAIVTVALGHLRMAHVISWALAAVTAIVIQLPLLDDARRNSEARGSRYLPGFGRRLVEVYLGEHRVVVAVVAGLCAVGCWSIGRRSRRHAIALAASIAFVVGVVLLLWQVVRPFDLFFRFFVALTPFIAALAAFGVYAVPRRLGAIAGAVALVLLVPGARDVVRTEPAIRDAAAVVDRARAEGRQVCGAHTEPLAVYTAPVRAIDPTMLDGPDGYGDCEVFVAVLNIGEAGRTVAAARFERSESLGGGITVYTGR